MSTDKELRAVSSVARHRILAVLRDEPATITQVATRLGIAKGSSSYHMRLLADVGLVEVVRTNKVRGVEERYYGLAAPTLEVAPSQRQIVMRHALADLEAATDLEQQLVRLQHARLDDAAFAVFTRKLGDLIAELAEANTPGAPAATVAIAFFRPVDHSGGPNDDRERRRPGPGDA